MDRAVPKENDNCVMSAESLRLEALSKRVYYAARDGLPITLYALLSEHTKEQQTKLLSQVCFAFYFFLSIYVFLDAVSISIP